MATYDLTIGGSANSNPPAAVHRGGIYRKNIIVDFKATPYLSADVLKLFDIPPGVIALAVGTYVETAEGATCTLSIGDSGSGAQYSNGGVNVNSAASRVLTTVGTGSKGYTAQDYISATLNNNASNGKVHIWALLLDFNTF